MIVFYKPEHIQYIYKQSEHQHLPLLTNFMSYVYFYHDQEKITPKNNIYMVECLTKLNIQPDYNDQQKITPERVIDMIERLTELNIRPDCDFFKNCILYFLSIKRPDLFLKAMFFIDEEPYVEKYFNELLMFALMFKDCLPMILYFWDHLKVIQYPEKVLRRMILNQYIEGIRLFLESGLYDNECYQVSKSFSKYKTLDHLSKLFDQYLESYKSNICNMNILHDDFVKFELFNYLFD